MTYNKLWGKRGRKCGYAIFIFCILGIFIISGINNKVLAEEVVLKDGKKIEGRIIGENPESITIIDNKTKKAVTIERKDIKSLTKEGKKVIDDTSKTTKMSPEEELLFSSQVILKKRNKVIEGRIIEESADNVVIIEKSTRKTLSIKRNEIKEIKKFDQSKLDEIKKKQEEQTESGSGFFANFRPMLGLLGSTGIAVGDIGTVVVPGGGVKAYFDMMFARFGGSFEFRSGLLVGFSYNDAKSENYTTNLMMLPIWAYADLAYALDFGLRPYFRLGVGITVVMLKGDPNIENLPKKNGFDLTLPISVGAGYTFKALPMIEWVLDFTTIIQFETISGYFISLSVGAAYKFYTGKGE